MKNLYKVLNIIALVAVIALLGGCFSPWAGDGATITINVGGGSGRAVFPPDDETLAQIRYTVELQGPSNITEQLAHGTQSINLSVIPGDYTITVTARLAEGELYAISIATAVARAGQSTRVDITMQYVGDGFIIFFETGSGSSINPQIVRRGDKVERPDNPTWGYYGFVNWYSDKALKNKFDFDEPVTSSVTSKITLYARWNTVTHTVTFINYDNIELHTTTVGEGGTLTPPEDPTRYGFVFDGWYSDDDFTTEYDFTAEIYSDTAIYAKWLQQFTVTFNANGGSPVPAQQTVTQGGKVTRPLNNPAQIGFVFDGWYSDDDFTVKYDFNNEIYSDTAIYAKWNESIIEMVSIPAGTFTMGSPTTEAERVGNETQHSVTLTGFYMGKYQVTQEQYMEVMGSNPSSFKTAVAGESGTPGKLPVETVSWYDAIVFCNKLSIMEGLNPVYSIGAETDPAEWGAVPKSSDATWNAVVMDKNKNGYRLPTEAEWEYACRAGTTTAWYTGNTENGTPHLNTAAWYSNNASSKTHEVGLKTGNDWGLYDMHGNVYEWCWDWLENYPSEAQNDPTGAVTGSDRVGRGGNSYGDGRNLRSAYRRNYSPSIRDYDIGFRLVRSLP
jgi:uncharacterized repeat protein (TIGR02543 family)